MTVRSRVARSAAALVLAGATLLGTAGCTFLTPTATLIQYDPSDGSGLTVGGVSVRNALLLPSEDGEVHSLVMSVFNTNQDGVEVLFQIEADGERIDQPVLVEGRSSVSYGSVPGQDQLLIEGIEGIPGSLVPIYVQVGDEPGEMLMVPILEPYEPAYEAIQPTNAPTPTPTPTVTQTPLDEPEPPLGGADETEEGAEGDDSVIAPDGGEDTEGQ
ncbi:MAG TPA: hypothetical protein VN241_04130 [Microbacterium sp.]|nr:hypothetical protein [Microbacterium sp.]